MLMGLVGLFVLLVLILSIVMMFCCCFFKKGFIFLCRCLSFSKFDCVSLRYVTGQGFVCPSGVVNTFNSTYVNLLASSSL